ncbi:MAG: DUF3822 family protein [Rikenellaceae bacterium]
MSIQVCLNGLSFFNTRGDAICEEVIPFNNPEEINLMLKKLRKLSSLVTINIVSDNFVLIPAKLYNDEFLQLYFRAKSLIYDSNKFSYFSDSSFGITMVVGCDKHLLESIKSFFSNIILLHPVSKVIKKSLATSSLTFISSNQRCAIAYAKGGKLQFADLLPTTNQLDTIYYLKKIISDYSINDNHTIYSLSDSSYKRAEKGIAEQIKNQIKHENS